MSEPSRRVFLSLLATSAFGSVLGTSRRAAASGRALIVIAGSTSSDLPLTSAHFGQHVRAEIDPYWRKDGEKAGTPAGAPSVLDVDLQWQNKSGDWKMLKTSEAKVNNRSVFLGELTEGAADTAYRIQFELAPAGATVPAGYELVIDVTFDLTDKAQEPEP